MHGTQTVKMSFTIPFPSVANNGTGETEAVVSHPFLPVPMDKLSQVLGHTESYYDVEPMVGELMFTNPTLTRKINTREKGSQQRCVVMTQRLVNHMSKDINGEGIEEWRFLGSFLNKMGGMYNIIVSRKASLLCPFAFLDDDKRHHDVATLDTVVLAYTKSAPKKSITVRIISSEERRKDTCDDANQILVPIGTVMFPPVRACASPLLTLIEGQSEDPQTKDRMTKLPVLIVELGTYI